MSLPKRTVEGTRYISVNDVKEMETDNSYIARWGDESINIDKHESHVILRYRLGDERMRVYVTLDTTKVGYGVRTWFNCPACKCRTANLYNVRGVFACRDCHNLTYLTCKRSGNKLDYLALKIIRLQKKLGLSGDDITEIPYFKPKNMHWKTYSELRALLIGLQAKRDREWLRLCKFYVGA